jgi:hypothetical protein
LRSLWENCLQLRYFKIFTRLAKYLKNFFLLSRTSKLEANRGSRRLLKSFMLDTVHKGRTEEFWLRALFF